MLSPKLSDIAKKKTVNIYTDTTYAFATIHEHGALQKKLRERGLLTSGGKDIQHPNKILALVEALWLPKKVAVIKVIKMQIPLRQKETPSLIRR